MSSLMKETERVRFNYISGEDVSEEDVRQALNFDIKNYVKEKYKIDIEFKNEEHHKDKNNKNIFFDSKYGNFIIEYKKPKVTIDSEVRSQLINYLHSLKDKKYNWGIVTNGLKVEVYVFSPEENDYIQLWKDEKHFSDDLTEDKFRYICDVLANRKNLILTENNINDYLGIENNKSIIRTIYKLLSNSTNERTALLYSEWQKLFNLSEQHDKFDKDKKREVTKFYSELLGQDINTIDKQYKALFSIQTYYSIMLKLVLYKIIIGERNIELENIDGYRKLFRNLESNNFYREHNIVNLIDGDFFSWYLNEFADEEFKYFYEKIVDIKTISYGKINMLFIKFYENIFPFWVRHSMGEYYTPDYLAEDVINNAISLVKNKDKKLQFLDPTCGSGIFILKSLEYLRKNNIEGQVYGVDINPLAVLTSKINYFINNQNPTEPLEIPIYKIKQSTPSIGYKVQNGWG